MMSNAFRAFVVVVVALAMCVRALFPALMSGEESKTGMLTRQFELVSDAEGFFLEFASQAKRSRLLVPKKWLIPSKYEGTDEESYVSPNQFDRLVPSFAIGDGRLGLHLSSFDAMREGSAQAAAGRDVFLLYDPKHSRLSKGLLDLGITKERVRVMGCFSAKAAHFLTGDINQDGLTDLGVVREELRCAERNDFMEGPFYEQAPVAWYVLGEGGWKLDATYSGKSPNYFFQMALVGMAMTPVDYVANALWKTYDPSRWKTDPRRTAGQSPLFIPNYRKKLSKKPSSGNHKRR
jgi:hypothetical protein